MTKEVMVEFFLVREEPGKAFTDFFGKFRFDWPPDTFDCTVPLLGADVNIASRDALGRYRREHEQVRRAYSEWSAG